jgi:transcriptional/translational regulatory protein YebC/TACO1
VDLENEYEVITEPNAFDDVKKALATAGIKNVFDEISMIPQTTVKLDEQKAIHMLKLMEQMEDNDDVQHVYANFDIPDAIMEKLSQSM